MFDLINMESINGLTAASEALTQMTELSKTIGLCAQEVDQLKSDNSRIQTLLRNKCEENKNLQNENQMLKNKCKKLENELKKFNNNFDVKAINDQKRQSLESQNSWDFDEEFDEYLANVSNDELLAQIENNNEINGQKLNQTYDKVMTNENKRFKTSIDGSNDYVKSKPIASTSNNGVNYGLNAIKVVKNSVNRTEDIEKKTVVSNVNERLNQFIASTSKVSNIEGRQTSIGPIDGLIKVTVYNGMSGQRMIFQVNSNDTVLSLKRKYQEREGYPCLEYKFVLGGQTLDANKRLSDYNVKNGSVIHCYKRLERV
jgi:hypothetical protein